MTFSLLLMQVALVRAARSVSRTECKTSQQYLAFWLGDESHCLLCSVVQSSSAGAQMDTSAMGCGDVARRHKSQTTRQELLLTKVALMRSAGTPYLSVSRLGGALRSARPALNQDAAWQTYLTSALAPPPAELALAVAVTR